MQQCVYKTKVSRKHKSYHGAPQEPAPESVEAPPPTDTHGDAAERLLVVLRRQWPMTSESILGLLKWSCNVLLRSRRQDILSDLVVRGELVPIKDKKGEVRYHIIGNGGEHAAVRPETGGGQ